MTLEKQKLRNIEVSGLFFSGWQPEMGCAIVDRLGENKGKINSRNGSINVWEKERKEKREI